LVVEPYDDFLSKSRPSKVGPNALRSSECDRETSMWGARRPGGARPIVETDGWTVDFAATRTFSPRAGVLERVTTRLARRSLVDFASVDRFDGQAFTS
jgi:hypothetical protein